MTVSGGLGAHEPTIQPLGHHYASPSNPLNDDRALTVQLVRIPLMAFLLAVFQTGAFMILQHAMFAAEMSVAKTTVADDALRRFFAVFVSTSDFPRRHAPAYGEGHIDGGRRWDVERGKGGGGGAGRQVFAEMDESERAGRKRSTE